MTVTSRELNRDVARAKRAAKAGPVFITDRGRPAHVLLSIGDYRRLAGERRSLLDALSMPGLADIDFEPPRAHIENKACDSRAKMAAMLDGPSMLCRSLRKQRNAK